MSARRSKSCACVLNAVFFFKQKTAYEMRISDWSSDVCSSDLEVEGRGDAGDDRGGGDREQKRRNLRDERVADRQRDIGAAGFGQAEPVAEDAEDQPADDEIGGASCRERVCQYV